MNAPTTRPLALLVELLAPAPAPETVASAERRAPPVALIAFTVSGLALYGAGAGLFQGGAQIGVAAAKAPLLVLLAIALTLPTLALTTTLAGVAWTARRLFHAILCFAAALALILVGLLPVAWLFSISSRHLLSPVVVHLLVWSAAVLLGRRALRAFLGGRGLRAFRWWTALFLTVSLQAATLLQPLLYREQGERLFPRPRQFFLSHLRDAARIVLPERFEEPESSAAGRAKSRRKPGKRTVKPPAGGS